VLVSCIDEEYQNKILCGITDYAEDEGYNVSIFTAFGGNLKNPKQDIGEYNIFNLINLSMFDGVILLTNTITSERVKEKIINSVNNSNVCVVSIDNTLPNTYNIGIDNFEAMSQVVRHFVDYHKFTRVNYVSGMDDNCDSIHRLNAYKSVLREYNIPVEEERIYHGNFRYESGIDAVNRFLNSSLEMPQAIVCANDVMALSTIKALKAHNIRVPQDVCVSGFDRIYDARNYSPEITTVERPLYEIGQLACEKIARHLNGETQPQSESIRTRVVVVVAISPKWNL
jgi:DNA-binding LacI/PurR family transcriptional regulator